MLVRAAFALALCSATAAAQDLDESRARALRAEARDHARNGRLEDAFARVRAAAGLSADPAVWLELAEAADRLRLDEIALDAYVRYLAARADAPDRGEIEGRIRVLRELVAGYRYVLEDARIVDWDGRPVLVRRNELISLAEWDGSLRHRAQPSSPHARNAPEGLGARLSPP